MRVYLLFGMVLLFAALILVQVGRIQFFQRAKWEKRAESERVYYKKIIAARGNILSDDGTILATSQPFFRLSMDPGAIKRDEIENFDGLLDELSRNLARQFGNSEFNSQHFKDLILKGIKRKDRHIYLVKRPVTYQEYKMARAWPLLNQSRYKGGLITERLNNKRFYPFKDLAKISLGVLANDSLALKGVEYSFNGFLRGLDGNLLVQRISRDIEIPLEQYGKNDAEDGLDVVTTLNIEMQDIAEAALREALERHLAEYGVVILMEVETGEIKAMANLKKSVNGGYYEGLNYAVSGRTEPGSTFKLASMIAALEDKAINLNDTVDTGEGYLQYYDKTMRDHVAHGKITYREGFELSSNVATSKMINDHYEKDPGQFIARLDQMGLLKPVKSQIIGEPNPTIVRPDDVNNWHGTTLPWLSIGYIIELTPLQTTTFYNAVANKGRMVQPLVVKEVRRGSKIEEKFEPEVLKKSICSKSTLEAVRKLLEGVVDHGTAENIKTDLYKIAGKTGTTQKAVDGHYQRGVYQASFVGYFPADNPKYTCYVLIDEPSNGVFYGSSVAAPVFRKIADQVFSMDRELSRPFREEFSNNQTKNPVTRIVNQQNAELVYNKLDISTPSQPESRWVQAQREGAMVKFRPMSLKPGIMPDVRGMSSRDALTLLENHGLKVVLKGSGKVRSQSLEAGRRFSQLQQITLELN